MNLRTLTYLIALAEERNFGRAAQRCFVSQPTLSAQIKKLEDELGVVLIERGAGKFLLTQTGVLIVDRARAMAADAKRIKEIATAHQDPLAGKLALGFIPTLGPYLMPHIIPALREALPKVNWHLSEYQTSVLLEKLSLGDLDMAIMALPHGDETHHALKEVALFDEPFVVALPPEHILTKNKSVAVSDLDETDLLLLEDGHCLRDQALSVCHRGTHNQNQEFTATSLETLRQMVAVGLGVTLLPLLTVGGAPASVQHGSIAIRPFRKPVPYRTVGAVWRASTAKTKVINQICETVCTTMVPRINALR